MKEFIEEYGGIVVITIIGLAVIGGMWEVVKLICLM